MWEAKRLPVVAVVISVVLALIPAATPDLSSDRAALLALRSAVGGRTLLWNVNNTTPCVWTGVRCENGRVTVLRLPGFAISGELPAGTVGNLTALRTLSLRLNALRGPLPADLASCAGLRNLYLQGNMLSGEIPGFLFSLKDLVRLNLASNNFSGEIPAGSGNLTRLKTFYVENNGLSGPIPELPSLDQFNVSNNALTGKIPAGLRKFTPASFSGTSLCGRPLDLCPGEPDDEPSGEVNIDTGGGGKRKGLSGGAVAGIVIGCVFAALLIAILLIFFCRRRRINKTRSVDAATALKHHPEDSAAGDKLPPPPPQAPGAENGNGNGNGFSVAAAAMKSDGNAAAATGTKKLVFFGNANAGSFDLEDLLRASAEVLGKGTFGTAYKAVLEAGAVVAVKRLKDVTISDREFREKIEGVGAMNHDNLVPLRAFYYSRDEKLLVYDYMPMGSLSALLHGNKGAGRTPLNWEIRARIALGAAQGIQYLHSHGSAVSHGNIKSSNVLLTKSYSAKVSDFGLAHLVGPSATPNRVAGYRAPEVTDPRRVSQKADVYSFGVLLLELLTGKPPTHALLNEEGVDLPRWVQSVVKEEWTSEVFDLELLRYHNVEEEMVQMLQLAIDCAAQYPDKRPAMPEVTSRIEELCRNTLREDHLHQPEFVKEAD